jgi:hypothetical protein
MCSPKDIYFYLLVYVLWHVDCMIAIDWNFSAFNMQC